MYFETLKHEIVGRLMYLEVERELDIELGS